MAPRRRRWRPELNEDVTEGILLRIPPDEPEHLIRASVVCKLWHRVVSDAAFLRRYRTFHRHTPLLGFFYHLIPLRPNSNPGFFPTTAASSPPMPKHSNRDRWVLDCRHSRFLLTETGSMNIVVWDPFSDNWDEIETPRDWYRADVNAVVFCAVPGCDHRSCHSGPFNVICVGVAKAKSNNIFIHTHVYSSESRSWCTPASAQLDDTICCIDMNRAALIGDGFYCTVDDGDRILKYDLVAQRLSLFDMPRRFGYVPVLMQNEDGSLGIAGAVGSGSQLWSTMVNAKGVARWVKQRVIKLKEMLPVDICGLAKVIGFAEGVKVSFLKTYSGAFTFELKSRKVRKVAEPWDYYGITPFISVFTPERGCSKWTK